MADEIKKEEQTKEEVTPEWAKNLQESLNSLPDRLASLLHPQQEETEETLDPTQPQEIPLPPVPEPETPRPEEVEPPQEQEKPKKKSLLDWLL